MLLKLAAAALVVGGAAAAGRLAAARLRRRPQELRQLQTALHVLRTEIDWGALPLRGALARAGRCVAGPASDLFAAAARALAAGDGGGADLAWRRAVEEVGPASALASPDREILLALGACLGASHREDQLRHLDVCLERLARAEDEARERAAGEARLYEQLGLLLGLLAALVAL